LAAPFALNALRSKVAGSRKNTEYQKMAGYGFQYGLDFFKLAFTRTFGPAGAVLRLAPALLGGQDAKGQARTLSNVIGFDEAVFLEVSEHLKSVPKDQPALLFGGLLNAAIFAASLEGNLGVIAEVELVCDGMCVSTAMRDAGLWAPTAVCRLAAPPKPPVAPERAGRLELAFAEACGRSGEEMLSLLQVWNSLQFTSAAKEWPANVKAAFLGLARAMLRITSARRAEVLAPFFETLSRTRPAVKGAILGGPPPKKGVPSETRLVEVPPTLRSRVLALLEVSLRVLCCDDPLEDTSQLAALFAKQRKLQDALAPQIWFEEDGYTLREEFAPSQKGGKQAKK